MFLHRCGLFQEQLICDAMQCINIVLDNYTCIYFTSIDEQVLTTYTNLSRFCCLGTTPVFAPNVWANENPKVDTSSRESNSGHYDCEADALPHDHGHHTPRSYLVSSEFCGRSTLLIENN